MQTKKVLIVCFLFAIGQDGDHPQWNNNCRSMSSNFSDSFSSSFFIEFVEFGWWKKWPFFIIILKKKNKKMLLTDDPLHATRKELAGRWTAYSCSRKYHLGQTRNNITCSHPGRTNRMKEEKDFSFFFFIKKNDENLCINQISSAHYSDKKVNRLFGVQISVNPRQTNRERCFVLSN